MTTSLGSKESEVSFTPPRLKIPPATPTWDHNKTPCPTLIAEVAIGRSKLLLERAMEFWTGPDTTVQLALGIKVFIRKEDPKTPRMLFVVSKRGSPEKQYIEFGPDIKDPPKVPLAVSDVYWGTELAKDLRKKTSTSTWKSFKSVSWKSSSAGPNKLTLHLKGFALNKLD